MSGLTRDFNYAVFNPFRDRSPEHAAAEYLNAMRQGDCARATELSSNVILPNKFTCEEMQSEYKDYRHAFIQPLRDRTDGNNEVILYYSKTGYEGNWVTVRHDRNGWRVIEFNKFW